MSDDRSPVGEDRTSGNRLTAHLDATKVLHDDFALLDLDRRFAAMVSEVAALKSKCERDAVGLQNRENVPLDDADASRQIESLLGSLEIVEKAIMATPARTIAGLGIKARHVAHVVSEHWDAPLERIDWDGRAVRLLVEAVCQAARVSLPFGGEANK
jgi:hypothetical protein